MQIIEIEEPGKNELQDEIVVGIDFGTTNSCVRVWKTTELKLSQMNKEIESLHRM